MPVKPCKAQQIALKLTQDMMLYMTNERSNTVSSFSSPLFSMNPPYTGVYVLPDFFISSESKNSCICNSVLKGPGLSRVNHHKTGEVRNTHSPPRSRFILWPFPLHFHFPFLTARFLDFSLRGDRLIYIDYSINSHSRVRFKLLNSISSRK